MLVDMGDAVSVKRSGFPWENLIGNLIRLFHHEDLHETNSSLVDPDRTI